MVENKKRTIVHLVRHGQTEWNERELIIGQCESELTKLGLEQAHNLKSELEEITPQYPWKNILVVSHEAIIQSLLIYWGGVLRERYKMVV
jgi:broad specificity phosphatase PhoE